MSQWQPQQYDPYAQQQYPSQSTPWQQPGQGQPPRRRKSWPARHKMLTGFLAFCGLLFVIGIAAAASSPSSSTSVPPAATQAAAPAVTQSASSAPAVKPHTVATFTGSGIQNTPKFTVTDTWKLVYTFNCASAGGTGNFIVDEDGGSDFSGASVNELGAGKTASTWVYGDAGTHYLSVNSECDWTVKIVDEG